jgi:hypothetical protein
MLVLRDHVLGREPMSELFARVIGLLTGDGTARGLLACVVLGGLGIFAINSAADVILTRSWIRHEILVTYEADTASA